MPRGTWEYARSHQIATSYDEVLASDGLCELDFGVIERHIARPGVLVDLGCGTGRLLLPYAQREFACIAVDLSPRMLEIVGQKSAAAGVTVDRILANLVQLDCLADGVADYCICMFSTLGMIRGRENRRRALEHARRILKPGGLFILHVHNRWSNLRFPQGRSWIFKNMLVALVDREIEAGDKVFDYLDVPKMFLHLYTRSELVSDLRAAGFQVVELLALDTARRQTLPAPWLLPRLRANGWLAVCK